MKLTRYSTDYIDPYTKKKNIMCALLFVSMMEVMINFEQSAFFIYPLHELMKFNVYNCDCFDTSLVVAFFVCVSYTCFVHIYIDSSTFTFEHTNT